MTLQKKDPFYQSLAFARRVINKWMYIDVPTKVICLCLIKYSYPFVPIKPHFVRGDFFSTLTI